MRISRIHIDQALTTGDTLALDERATRYVSQVLRLRTGDPLLLFNGDGREMHATIDACSRRHCAVTVADEARTEPPPALSVHLAIGISRGERMDYALQKSVELGVTEITPLLTHRGVVQLKADRIEQKKVHWHGVVIAACEQSGRCRLPLLNPPDTPDDWIPRHPNGLLLHHEADNSLPTMPAPASAIALLIGPEGGLDVDERELARQHGFTAVRLGPRILRTETAPLAALAAIQTLWGDFR